MKIILEASALHPPLTGIGRYTLELAKRLRSQPDVEQVQYLIRGRLVDDILIDNKSGTTQKEASQHTTEKHLPSGLKLALFGPFFSWTARAFSALGVRLRHSILFAKHILRSLTPSSLLQGSEDPLVHAPNFVAPLISSKNVITIHDLSIFKYPECHPAKRVRHLTKSIPKAVKTANYIITDSEFTRHEVIDHFNLEATKVVAIPLGVDDAFKPRERGETGDVLHRYGLEYGAYCLTVSTLEPRKNIIQLINCYLNLPENSSPKRPLVIVGNQGWNSKPIMDLIQQGEARSAIHYLNIILVFLRPLLLQRASQNLHITIGR